MQKQRPSVARSKSTLAVGKSSILGKGLETGTKVCHHAIAPEKMLIPATAAYALSLIVSHCTRAVWLTFSRHFV